MAGILTGTGSGGTGQLKSSRKSCGIKGKSPRGILRWKLHQKQRLLTALRDKLIALKSENPSLIFGGKKLWNAQFNLEASGRESPLG
jgi:hypothetical protein